MNNNTPFKGFKSLSELGEFGLIDQIAILFGTHENADEIGIGDDCAVLPYGENRSLLITTDMLIEGRHFRHDWISVEDLGYKSLAVNLSDISAMGGKPRYAFLSIGLPDDLSLDWVERYFNSAQDLSNKHDVKLLGGDTTKSPGPMVINYIVIGEAPADSILWRSAAEAGDSIALLGGVGESGAGLKVLMEQSPPYDENHQKLINAHNRPRLFVDEAQYLASFPSVHSMIDLSDGIQSDAGHIADRSGRTMEIETDYLPIQSLLREVCTEYSWNPLELALTAGEDYGLLFTLSKEESERVSRKFLEKFGFGFTIIGEVKEGPAELKLMRNGKEFDVGKKGFDHFKSG